MNLLFFFFPFLLYAAEHLIPTVFQDLEPFWFSFTMAVPTALVFWAYLRSLVNIMLERTGFFAFWALGGATSLVSLWIKNISKQNVNFTYQVQLIVVNVAGSCWLQGSSVWVLAILYSCKFCSSAYILMWPFSLLLAEKTLEGRFN